MQMMLHFAGKNINFITNVDFITLANTNVTVKIAFYALLHKKQEKLNIKLKRHFIKKEICKD
jgi:hypothetical protein